MCERWLLQWGVEKSCESWTDWMSYFSVSKQNCEVHWLLTDSGLAHIGHSASEVVKGFLVTCWACYSQCELLDESSNSTTVWQPLGKAHCVNTVPPSVWQRQPHDTSRPALIQPWLSACLPASLPACLPVCQPPIQPVMQLKCQRTNLRFRPHTGGCVNTETHTHILGFFLCFVRHFNRHNVLPRTNCVSWVTCGFFSLFRLAPCEIIFSLCEWTTLTWLSVDSSLEQGCKSMVHTHFQSLKVWPTYLLDAVVLEVIITCM